MNISKDDFIKAAQISGMIGYKQGFETCLMLIETLGKVPNCDINVIIEYLKKTYKETLKESETDITEDEIKFLNNLLNDDNLDETSKIC